MVEYGKMKLEELKKKCNEKGISDMGEKDDLVTRLTNYDLKVSHLFPFDWLFCF